MKYISYVLRALPTVHGIEQTELNDLCQGFRNAQQTMYRFRRTYKHSGELEAFENELEHIFKVLLTDFFTFARQYDILDYADYRLFYARRYKLDLLLQLLTEDDDEPNP